VANDVSGDKYIPRNLKVIAHTLFKVYHEDEEYIMKIIKKAKGDSIPVLQRQEAG
jgi:hypothetical protein